MSNANSKDSTVSLVKASTVRNRDTEVNEMWINQGVVPGDYIESILGPSSETISIRDDVCYVYGNGVVKIRSK